MSTATENIGSQPVSCMQRVISGGTSSWYFTSALLVLGILMSVFQAPPWIAACFIFLLAGLNVIENDSIQTLGTCLASMRNFFGKKTWIVGGTWFGLCMLGTHLWSWHFHAGDLSFGKLTNYPEPKQFTMLMILAPVLLRVFTKYSVPVSTTFLMLSLYATNGLVIPDAEKMSFWQHLYAFFSKSEQIVNLSSKSFGGYIISFFAPMLIWLGLLAYGWHSKGQRRTKEEANNDWRLAVVELFASSFLWINWLMHDTANITVMFTRQFTLLQTLGVVAVLGGFLFLILKQGGGPIQKVILEKSGTTDIRSAIVIDLCFGLMLFLKNLTPTPMSTTFVFVGLLAGREFVYGWFHPEGSSLRESWAMARNEKRFFGATKRISVDAVRLTIGVILSMALVYLDFVLNG